MTGEAAHPFDSLSPLEDHLAAPRGRGGLADSPHAGAAGGAPCGDLVRLSLRVDGERVADAGFDASGCAAAVAAGSAAVELVRGQAVLEAARVDAGAIASTLGGLPPSRRHAAALAADALHRALGAAAGAGAIRLAASRARTLVAVSGGVDSAVAMRLALDAGHEVVAVTLELWDDPAGDGARSCCSAEAVTGARALAHSLGVPHLTLDVRDRFRDAVVGDFVAEHAAARTPNPCIRCNGLVRFDTMLALAGALGAARLATGHYARIDADRAGPLVRAAAARDKDQSYMLARLEPELLERLWFPLGELDKPAVRELARRAGLPVASKPESQDLCFLAGLGADGFLRRHGAALVPGFEHERHGELADADGRVLGAHRGQHRFTVGQRRGLGVAGPEPLYVLRKDAGSNRVTIGPRRELETRRVTLTGARLHRRGTRVDSVKLRYRSGPVGCRLDGAPGAGSHERLTVELAAPVEGVAPGQTACLMQGESVIGCGIIAAPAPPMPLPIAAPAEGEA